MAVILRLRHSSKRLVRFCVRHRIYLTGVLTGLLIAIFLLIIFSSFVIELYMKSQVHTYTEEDSLKRLSIPNPISPDQLYKDVRILCFVLTSPPNHHVKAIHVKNTWGRRCNKLIFMSSKDDLELGIIGLPNMIEGRPYLWMKTKGALEYVYKHHIDEADWFLKADDDSYVILEHLRYVLKDFDTDKRISFGLRLKKLLQPEYLDGGAGYVLSKETLKLLNEVTFAKNGKCSNEVTGIGEDVQLYKCLRSIGAAPIDSRDDNGRHRFMKHSPEEHFFPNPKITWYWEALYYPQKPGMDCCSDTAISFHYISPKQMYVMEYLIYHMNPYKIFQAENNFMNGNKTLQRKL